MAFRPQPKGFATKAIHVGQDPEQWSHQSVIPPLVTSTTFKQPAPAEPILYEYGRSGNPTRDVLEKCFASLDNGKYGLAFSSGLGTTTIITQLLSAGDHIISCDDVYGGTNRLFSKVTARLGIEIDFVDAINLDNVKKAIKKNTRLVWIETPTNPCMKVLDIEAISKLAHSYENIIVVVDNTFITSYFQRPLELGADIVAYSVSKYMNGHSDVIMGAAVVNDDNLYERLKFLQNASGVIPSPFDCYQVNRSLKTLKLRMEQHWKSSVIVAEFLESHPNVERVLHPGIPSHPQYKLVLKQTYGHSGIMSFYLKGGLNESKKFLQSLKVFTLAESLGGYESLAELPSLMTHASVPAEQRVVLGINDSLIRLSVGLEDVEDLVDDLKQALKATFD
ncbi:cystathionine gamma-lyase [Contarinia nasturtii]|uniref:cystathionine gamma-lyase n=1 Tax=Contarinia nasturtii TaxID=265458 RepID=UPI0012D3F4C3|nr:cystathionine gamma-lyase [Contarinia nasturtii]